MEQRLAEARERKHEAYRKANDLMIELQDKDLDWAVYEIRDALYYGKTVDSYLEELAEHSPLFHANLVK